MLSDLLRLRRRYREFARLREIANVFVKHGLGYFIDRLNLYRVLPVTKRLRLLKETGQLPPSVPERLRMAFVELGPSFIKLAQVLSSRPDLITERYAREFSKLQDRVPPFGFEEVKKTIEEDFKQPLEKLFREIDPEPVAAASIAQVHYATLWDGSEVVVKVQRPGIEDIIERDIVIMQTIANLMIRYMPETEFMNPVGIVNEFSRTIRHELDFREEAKNLCRFRRNFEGHPDVYFPKLYPELVSRRVIVMERLEGTKIDDLEVLDELGHDRAELARKGVAIYFKMFLEDGFFHGDPHPGNIFVLSDGRLGLVDFGIVGFLTPELQEAIATVLVALVRKDFDTIIDQYIKIGLVREDMDITAFRREFKADMIDLLMPLYDMPISEIDLTKYLEIVIQLAIKHKLQVPSDLLLMDKCMLILENIGRQLDPNFNFMTVVEPYAEKLIRGRFSPRRIYDLLETETKEIVDLAVQGPRQLRSLIKKTLNDNLHINLSHEGLDRLMRDIDRSTNRLAFSIVLAAIILASSILTISGIGGKTFFGIPMLGLIGFTVAAVFGFWLLISIIRSGRL
ncbi:MAG: AarF/ABC1/UbiB kinase family protein [Nitrospirae bacterium]|nr:MAG: AarF/ABC1/UbiB kinase family protein [Nitrospirota bacterium]